MSREIVVETRKLSIIPVRCDSGVWLVHVPAFLQSRHGGNAVADYVLVRVAGRSRASRVYLHRYSECESEWTEAEAIAEKERDFGSIPLEQCDIVCDLCYQQISPQNNPDYYTDYQSAMAAHPNAKPLCFNTPLPTTLMLEDTETIRAYIDAELTRALTEWWEQQETEILFGKALPE